MRNILIYLLIFIGLISAQNVKVNILLEKSDYECGEMIYYRIAIKNNLSRNLSIPKVPMESAPGVMLSLKDDNGKIINPDKHITFLPAQASRWIVYPGSEVTLPEYSKLKCSLSPFFLRGGVIPFQLRPGKYILEMTFSEYTKKGIIQKVPPVRFIVREPSKELLTDYRELKKIRDNYFVENNDYKIILEDLDSLFNKTNSTSVKLKIMYNKHLILSQNNEVNLFPKNYFSEKIMTITKKSWEQYFVALAFIHFSERTQVLDSFIENNIQHPLLIEYSKTTNQKFSGFEYKVFHPN